MARDPFSLFKRDYKRKQYNNCNCDIFNNEYQFKEKKEITNFEYYQDLINIFEKKLILLIKKIKNNKKINISNSFYIKKKKKLNILFKYIVKLFKILENKGLKKPDKQTIFSTGYYDNIKKSWYWKLIYK